MCGVGQSSSSWKYFPYAARPHPEIDGHHRLTDRSSVESILPLRKTHPTYHHPIYFSLTCLTLLFHFHFKKRRKRRKDDSLLEHFIRGIGFRVPILLLIPGIELFMTQSTQEKRRNNYGCRLQIFHYSMTFSSLPLLRRCLVLTPTCVTQTNKNNVSQLSYSDVPISLIYFQQKINTKYARVE